MTALEVSAVVARGLLRMVVRDLTRAHRDGLDVPLWAPALCRDLAAIADAEPPAWLGSVAGTGPGSVNGMGEGMATVADAALQVGKSAEYVRRLARDGRIRRHRVGRVWLVELDSLRSVLRRAA